MCQFDLILSRLIRSVVAEGFDAANGPVCLVEGLCENVRSADDTADDGVRHVLACESKATCVRFLLTTEDRYVCI